MQLHELSATEAAALIRDKEISSEELTRACLERIEARDGTVHAFAHLDPEYSLAEARRMDGLKPESPLHGVPFATKDVIDTRDFPTERGTPIHRGRRSAEDAHCVKRMRAAGAVSLGKLVTTEYAMFTPNETRHPLNPAHTPGGSSSGTAAAVADRMVPIAFGNQTAGSLIRPAAYCGVYGLKPTHGTVDGTGIMPLQLYFDTLGYMARSIDDLQSFYGVVSNADQTAAWAPARRPRIGLCATYQWEHAEAETREVFARVAEQLATTGFDIERFSLPPDYADLVAVHRRILYHGIAGSLREDYARAPEKMSAGLREVIAEGMACGDEPFSEALARAERCRGAINGHFDAFDAIICPSAPGEAPAGTATGNPIFQVTWTLLGVPCLNLPVGFGTNNLPLGVQLVGPRHGDAGLMAIGKEIMRDFQAIRISA